MRPRLETQLVLDLLTRISKAILGRKSVCRSTGPHFTIQVPYCAWAADHGLAGHNICHRTMKRRVRCQPPSGMEIMKVVHQVSWRGGFQYCPDEWLKSPIFTKDYYLPNSHGLATGDPQEAGAVGANEGPGQLIKGSHGPGASPRLPQEPNGRFTDRTRNEPNRSTGRLKLHARCRF